MPVPQGRRELMSFLHLPEKRAQELVGDGGDQGKVKEKWMDGGLQVNASWFPMMTKQSGKLARAGHGSKDSPKTTYYYFVVLGIQRGLIGKSAFKPWPEVNLVWHVLTVP
jgi:hypothetical protein